MTTDYGPQTRQIEALIARIRTLTDDEAARLAATWCAARYAALYDAWCAARYAARDAARYAARYDAWGAAWDAVRDAALDAARLDAWYAARDAVLALMVRDLIPTEHYDVLTQPWRQAVGRIHPDDPDLQETMP